MHFVRHGQSFFNVGIKSGRDPGIIDAGLTEIGFRQAERAAVELKGQGIEEVICSPYTRALQTASVIAKVLNVPMHVDPAAGERSIYSCDIGTPTSELKTRYPHLDFSSLANETWWPANDETHAALKRRAENFIHRWRDRLATTRFALVSHWYFLNHVTGHDFDNGEVLYKKIV